MLKLMYNFYIGDIPFNSMQAPILVVECVYSVCNGSQPTNSEQLTLKIKKTSLGLQPES